MDCKKQIVTFYTFKQKTKRTEQSLLSMYSPESITPQENTIQVSVNCSLCDTTFDTEMAFVQHAQQAHPEMDLYDVENATTKDIKVDTKNQQIEIYDFETVVNAENSSEAELITNEVQIDDENVLSVEEESEAEPTHSLRSRTVAGKRKLPTITNPKAKVAAKLKQKPTTSKTVFKAEISDIDENVDITDEFELEQTGSESLDLYECPLCSTQFVDKDEYLQHCTDHDQEYQCVGCNELFTDGEHMLQHNCEGEIDKNENDEDLMCVPCNKRLKSSAQLRQHIKMHDSMGLIIEYLDFFPCHECCQLFITKEKLSEHNSEFHDGKAGKELLTDKIDESCTDYQFLDDDKQSEFKEGEVYSCGECNQSYQTINELKYHVVLHANKFECPIAECGCQYDQMSRLSIHVLNKHINTKNLQCLHCSQTFTTYDDLQAHLKNFCKEKKYKCPECGT